MDDDDDDDDDDDLLVGLARPQLNAATGVMPVGGDDEDDEDDDEEEQGAAAGAAVPPPPTGQEEDDDDDDDDEALPGGLVGAEAAFALGTAPDALELDPFRVAAGAEIASAASESSAAAGQKKAKAGGAIPGRIFVANLPHSMDDAGLVRFFARYGKVQEAHVAMADNGRSKGFGFVNFVHDKGARFCIKEAGDPPSVSIDGRDCTVRYAERKDDHGARQHKMPARGNVDYLGLNAKRHQEREAAAAARGQGSSSAGGDEMAAPSISMIAAAHKRAAPAVAPAVAQAAGGGKRKKDNDEKGIVTVSRRQDAEPLNKAPITMREIFPKVRAPLSYSCAAPSNPCASSLTAHCARVHVLPPSVDARRSSGASSLSQRTVGATLESWCACARCVKVSRCASPNMYNYFPPLNAGW